MPADSEILAALLVRAQRLDNRTCIRCADAFAVADALGLAPEAIGRICDLENIKIVTCQLGCFS